jgi:hypothetical protein
LGLPGAGLREDPAMVEKLPRPARGGSFGGESFEEGILHSLSGSVRVD